MKFMLFYELFAENFNGGFARTAVEYNFDEHKCSVDMFDVKKFILCLSSERER